MDAYLEDNELSEDMTGNGWPSAPSQLAPEWIRWAAESRLAGNSDEQITATLYSAGYDQTAVAWALGALQDDPCYSRD